MPPNPNLPAEIPSDLLKDSPKDSTKDFPLGPRERLIDTALRLFAAQGFARTSIRMIADQASVNVSAIKYYFNDKLGLYRAVYNEPSGPAPDIIALQMLSATDLRASLAVLFSSFFEPLKEGEKMAMISRLHFREVLEPLGVFDEEIEQRIKPASAMFTRMLTQCLELEAADDDVHRLTFSILGLGVQMIFTHDVVKVLQPQLVESPAAIDVWSARMIDFAIAIIATEYRRRYPTRPLPVSLADSVAVVPLSPSTSSSS